MDAFFRNKRIELNWIQENLERIVKEIEGYDTDKSGAFSYKVNDNIESKDFIVYENEKKDQVYCTGIILQLNKDFIKADKNFKWQKQIFNYY